MEVWFQRATDVVRKLSSGDIDIGIVGYDMLREIGDEDDELVVVHDFWVSASAIWRSLYPVAGKTSIPCLSCYRTSAGPKTGHCELLQHI